MMVMRGQAAPIPPTFAEWSEGKSTRELVKQMHEEHIDVANRMVDALDTMNVERQNNGAAFVMCAILLAAAIIVAAMLVGAR